MLQIFLFIRYSRRILNYLERIILSYITYMMVISVETPRIDSDGYYVAYKPITLLCISFLFIEIRFTYCHSCVMF